MDYFLIWLGGGLGSMARFWVSSVVAQKVGQAFPFGTLLVNVTGSLLIGFLAGLTLPEGRFMVSPQVRTFFMIGICGGYTTFSSFSLQTLNLAQDGEWLWAGLNILGSVALCLVAVWVGYMLAMTVNKL
jgi:CrcB protein